MAVKEESDKQQAGTPQLWEELARATPIFPHPPPALEQNLILQPVSRAGHVFLAGDVAPTHDLSSPGLPGESHLQLSMPTPPGC